MATGVLATTSDKRVWCRVDINLRAQTLPEAIGHALRAAARDTAGGTRPGLQRIHSFIHGFQNFDHPNVMG